MGLKGSPVLLRKTNLMIPKLARTQTLRVLCPRPGCYGATMFDVQQIEGQLPNFPIGEKRKCDTCGKWMKIQVQFHVTGAIPE